MNNQRDTDFTLIVLSLIFIGVSALVGVGVLADIAQSLRLLVGR